ncbi:MAG: response regulator transcription factor [Gammaproteobacteria bacterium]
MKILVVEDSEKLRKSLKTGLGKLGYAVDFAIDGEQGLQFALHGEYDVIVLDLMLPRKSGLEVLREIRLSKQNPEVLILSARDQTRDRIAGLELGADDYLVKPFAFDELHARIQALVRRKYRFKSPIIIIGSLQIDTSLHKASIGSNDIALTPTEMSILEYLAISRGRVISPDKLCHIYDSKTYVSKNSIEVHISILRKKLRLAFVEPIIKTQRGFGYYID